MSDLKRRGQFEAWIQGTSGWKACAKRGKPMSLRTRFDGSYADYRVNDRWGAWLAAIIATLPSEDR